MLGLIDLLRQAGAEEVTDIEGRRRFHLNGGKDWHEFMGQLFAAAKTRGIVVQVDQSNADWIEVWFTAEKHRLYEIVAEIETMRSRLQAVWQLLDYEYALLAEETDAPFHLAKAYHGCDDVREKLYELGRHIKQYADRIEGDSR